MWAAQPMEAKPFELQQCAQAKALPSEHFVIL